MKKAINIRHELAYQLENIPAEHIKQAVIEWLNMGKEAVPESLQSFMTDLIASQEDAETSFSQTASYEEWSKEFRKIVESHRGEKLPILSDEDISRESMYPDRF